MRIVKNGDLEATWTVLRAKEPGFMRSLVTWMGGPEGYINTNPGVAVESRHCAVGLMDMGPGNRQPGVHTHTIDEIYVILKGQAESFDGVGNRHLAGPLDCLYIPKGVPHGVRTVGDAPLKLLWVNDDIERWGVSVYAEGAGPHVADDEVRLIPFATLEPSWNDGRAAQAGSQWWRVRWVTGRRQEPSRNTGAAPSSDRIDLGLTIVEAANRLRETAAVNSLHVVVRGRCVGQCGGRTEVLGAQDAVYCQAGEPLDLRALGDEPLYVVSVRDSGYWPSSDRRPRVHGWRIRQVIPADSTYAMLLVRRIFKYFCDGI